MILTINGQQVALKKDASIEYVSENRIFTRKKPTSEFAYWLFQSG